MPNSPLKIHVKFTIIKKRQRHACFPMFSVKNGFFLRSVHCHRLSNTPFSASHKDNTARGDTLVAVWMASACLHFLSFSWGDRTASIIRRPSALLYTGTPLCSELRDSWLKQCKSQRALSQWREQRHIHCVTDGASALPSCPSPFSHSDVVRTSDNMDASSACSSKNCNQTTFGWKNKQKKNKRFSTFTITHKYLFRPLFLSLYLNSYIAKSFFLKKNKTVKKKCKK